MYKKMVDCSPPVKRAAHPYFRVTRILGFKNVISDHSSKSNLPFGGLQHMQQCKFQALIQMNGA